MHVFSLLYFTISSGNGHQMQKLKLPSVEAIKIADCTVISPAIAVDVSNAKENSTHGLPVLAITEQGIVDADKCETAINVTISKALLLEA